MANIRFENFTGDTVIVCFKDNRFTLQDEERVTIEAVEKGQHKIRVHRARIPMETEDFHEVNTTDFKAKTERSERSQHVQLDGEFIVNVNAAKSVVSIKTKVKAKEKFGIDAIFSGYSVEVSGAKLESERQIFPNKNTRKRFITHQLKEAFLPVGGGGIFLLILGIIALRANILGKSVNIGGQEFSYPWTIGLLAVALGFIGYTVFIIVNIIKNANAFKE